MIETKYSVKLPLDLDSDGQFIYIKEYRDNIKQKLKTIVLTNPGEKIMDFTFGLGIKKYLFESMRNQNYLEYTNENNEKISRPVELEERIKNILTFNVSEHVPEIIIENVILSRSESIKDAYNLKIEYFIKYLGSDSVSMNITAG